MILPKIKGKGFLLRPLVLSDAKSIVENGKHAAFHRSTFTLFIPRTHESAIKWIEKNTEESKKKNPGIISFAIDVGGEVVGSIGLMGASKGHMEIGYWLAQKYCGKGIMMNAGKLVTKYSFNMLGLTCIFAPVSSFDEASMRILEENGFTKEKLETSKSGRVFKEEVYIMKKDSK